MVLSLLVLTGLGRYVYREPPADQPHATLLVTSDREGFAKVQMFSEFKDEHCTPPGNVMAAFNASRKKEKTLRLRPDDTIHVLASVVTVAPVVARKYEPGMGAGSGMGKHYCNSAARITPVAGKTYRLSQAATGACPIKLVDADTGEKPPEVEWLPISDGCGQTKVF